MPEENDVISYLHPSQLGSMSYAYRILLPAYHIDIPVHPVSPSSSLEAL